MDALLGTEFSLPMKFFVAFAIVLVLIAVAAYLVRRFGAGALAATALRNRQFRLAVVDSADIDTRRRLVIVRRDNVEHLLLIGGPTDVLVESNIVRAAAVQTVRETPARAGTAEPMSSPEAGAEGGWPHTIQPVTPPPSGATVRPLARPEPLFRPEPAAHAAAILSDAAFRPEAVTGRLPNAEHAANAAPPPPSPQWVPADVIPHRPAAPSIRLSFEAPATAAAPAQDLDAVHDLKPETPAAPQAAPQGAPRVLLQPLARTAGGKAEPVKSTEEQNLADMAQRLEAALRRPLSASALRAPSAPAPLRSAPSPARPAAVAPTPGPAATPRSETPTYENLQREMANLLGRQPGSS